MGLNGYHLTPPHPSTKKAPPKKNDTVLEVLEASECDQNTHTRTPKTHTRTPKIHTRTPKTHTRTPKKRNLGILVVCSCNATDTHENGRKSNHLDRQKKNHKKNSKQGVENANICIACVHIAHVYSILYTSLKMPTGYICRMYVICMDAMQTYMQYVYMQWIYSYMCMAYMNITHLHCIYASALHIDSISYIFVCSMHVCTHATQIYMQHVYMQTIYSDLCIACIQIAHLLCMHADCIERLCILCICTNVKPKP